LEGAQFKQSPDKKSWGDPISKEKSYVGWCMPFLTGMAGSVK
jgi:hypothetical protein